MSDNLEQVWTETPQIIIPWWFSGIKVWCALNFVFAVILTTLVSTNTISAWWAVPAVLCYVVSVGMVAK